MSEDGLRVVVIYRDPSDYPGKYVARAQWARGDGSIAVEPEPLAVVDTLDAVRASVPAGMTRFHRSPTDDPVIVETWF